MGSYLQCKYSCFSLRVYVLNGDQILLLIFFVIVSCFSATIAECQRKG